MVSVTKPTGAKVNPIHLVTLAQIYAGHVGLAVSTVATYAQRDGKFFSRLEAGGDCTSRVSNRVCTWFVDHWPADLTWPSDIPRPPKSKKEAA